MAFAYCHRCECGLNNPSPREIIELEIECPRCSAIHEIDVYYKNELILDLIERVTVLEKKTS